jgi:hypothetical protein
LEQDHRSTPITFWSTIDSSFRKFFGDTSDNTLLQFHTIFQEGAGIVDEALNRQDMDHKLNALNQRMAVTVDTLEKLVTASSWTTEAIKSRDMSARGGEHVG